MGRWLPINLRTGIAGTLAVIGPKAHVQEASNNAGVEEESL